jgi:hypothetical protein
MGIAFILIGLFLWFALAFNGGVGETFVNYSFFTSALFMIITGALATTKSNRKAARNLCSIALVCYLPMIWQRFNYSFGADWGGLFFDIIFVVLMVIFLLKKPNKAPQPTPKNGAAEL